MTREEQIFNMWAMLRALDVIYFHDRQTDGRRNRVTSEGLWEVGDEKRLEDKIRNHARFSEGMRLQWKKGGGIQGILCTEDVNEKRIKEIRNRFSRMRSKHVSRFLLCIFFQWCEIRRMVLVILLRP